MILCLGVPKSGTSTLHRAFSEAGYHSVHGRRPNEPHAATLMWRAFCEGKNPISYVSREIEVVSDPFLTNSITLWPTLSPLFMERLIKDNPDIWLILNTRILKHWLLSVKAWKQLQERLTEADLPFLPSGTGADRELTDWIEAYYARIRAALSGRKRYIELAIEDDNRELLSNTFEREFPWWGVENARNPVTKGED